MKIWNRGSIILVLAVLGYGARSSAAIRSTAPAVVEVEPPATVAANATQSDTMILAFNERQCVTLAADLEVNAVAPGLYRYRQLGQHVVPAGTVVSCHLVHFDPPRPASLGGSVTFDSPILGVIAKSRDLAASDPVCGLPETTYTTRNLRGIDDVVADSLTIVAPSRLGVNLRADSPGDHVRIVTACGSSGSEDPPASCDPPTLTSPADLTVECAAPAGTRVALGGAVATDRCCDAAPVVTHDGPSRFPVGTTEVSWTATDCRGQATHVTQRVTVQDTVPPRISAKVLPTVLWPPDHRMVPVKAAVRVVDTCSSTPSWVVASVSSSEPDDAPGDGDGRTTGDIQEVAIGSADASMLLRAERAGDGPGRVYTVSYRATDDSGNGAETSIEVRVPHDRGVRKRPARRGSISKEGASGGRGTRPQAGSRCVGSARAVNPVDESP